MNREQAEILLRKYNEGNVTVEEAQLIENWFQQEFTSHADPTDQPNYLQIKQEMWQHIIDEVVPTPKVYTWKYLVAAAAAILIISMTSILFFSRQTTVVKTRVALVDSIVPGKNRAILTLNDGRKISLSEAKNGELAQQSGVIIRKSADGKLIYRIQDNLAPANAPSYNTIEAPRGGQWQIILPDGSKVYLNALSSLTFPTKFANNERRVELKGEGYFEVAHDKKAPFRVITAQQQVEVLGTHFNIMAYPEDKLSKTTLLSGSVKVTQAKNTSLLQPGQQAQVSIAGIKITNQIDLDDVIAWKNGYFKFNENLETIMTKIARWYDVEVIYERKPDPNFRYQGEISREKSIRELLDMLTYIGNVRFEIEGRRIVVK